ERLSGFAGTSSSDQATFLIVIDEGNDSGFGMPDTDHVTQFERDQLRAVRAPYSPCDPCQGVGGLGRALTEFNELEFDRTEAVIETKCALQTCAKVPIVAAPRVDPPIDATAHLHETVAVAPSQLNGVTPVQC